MVLWLAVLSKVVNVGKVKRYCNRNEVPFPAAAMAADGQGAGMIGQPPGLRQYCARIEDEFAHLPPPDAVAQAHSQRLAQRIWTEIETAGGALPFARYMELALYAPALGYYVAGARKFGADGDFVTAPELSPLFGRCIARACSDALNACGSARVLEFGAGSGAMAADLLGEWERLDTLPAEYLILEVSPELRARQRQCLQQRVPHLCARVRWLDALPEAGFDGVVLANEVLDAMPVHRFRIHAGAIEEQYVVVRDGRLSGEYRPAGAPLVAAVEHLQRDLDAPLAEGYASEISLAHGPWLKSVAACLARALVLLIDYGHGRAEYYHPQRHSGTLMCHYRHRAHEHAFAWPGLQDITAHVDFTALAEAADAAGLQVAGFTTQAHFLIGSGLDAVLAACAAENTLAQLELARQVKLLTLPGEMGERFKVMALTRNLDLSLAAFSVRDLRSRI